MSLGLLLGFALDRAFGDPQRWHPVAGFGNLATAIERRLYADSRGAGAVEVAALVGPAVLVGALIERAHGGSFLVRNLSTAGVTWMVLGGRSLEREARAVQGFLDVGELPQARRQVQRLVGRATDQLGVGEVARAAVESVAENTADAVVAPLFWGAVAGIPGLLGYRAANTLDAMIGHRSERYNNYGWAAARLDDLLNLVPARACGALTLLARPSRAGAGWRAWQADAAGHPSPNAGVVEAAFAGVLGIRLGGQNTYGDRVEDRPVMGSGRPASREDIGAATLLARRVGWLSAGAAAGVGYLIRERTQSRAWET